MRSLLQKMFPTAWTPRSGAHDAYPYDLDGALRFTRPRTGQDYYPTIGGDGTIEQIGMVSGFMGQMDSVVYQPMFTGKIPFGPGIMSTPINLQWQITVPGLTKFS